MQRFLVPYPKKALCCSIRGESFFWKLSLQTHIFKWSSTRSLVCTMCYRRTSNSSATRAIFWASTGLGYLARHNRRNLYNCFVVSSPISTIFLQPFPTSKSTIVRLHALLLLVFVDLNPSLEGEMLILLPSLTYLGHAIDASSTLSDPLKVKAILECHDSADV